MRALRLSVSSMRCRHCVRDVTARLRDVPGVETVTADAGTGIVLLGGSMLAADVLAVLSGTSYVATVLEGSAASP